MSPASEDLLAAGVFGDGLCAFTDGVLGQFTGQQEPDSGLDLSACDCRSLVVVSESGSFSGDSLEDVVDEAVHDGHGFARDTSVRVHLFQNLVDVDSVGFPPPPPLFLVIASGSLCLSGGFLGPLACDSGFLWHDSIQCLIENVVAGSRACYLYDERRIDLLSTRFKGEITI